MTDEGNANKRLVEAVFKFATSVAGNDACERDGDSVVLTKPGVLPILTFIWPDSASVLREREGLPPVQNPVLVDTQLLELQLAVQKCETVGAQDWCEKHPPSDVLAQLFSFEN